MWGTTANGGASNCGTAFKTAVNGKPTRVLAFNCTDGDEAQGLTLGTDGSYYGVTESGGSYNGGTVFKLSLKGELTVLYNFTVEGSTGYEAVGSLVQGIDGNFYGATFGGGSPPGYGNGTLFKITPSGTLTTLYMFDFTHGAQPQAGPIQDTDGNFYGTTNRGGTYGGGTVYKMTPKGVLTVLYNFGGSDGSPAFAGLIQDADGNFYGTTSYGGPDNDGAVFKITPKGAFTILHTFAETDGRSPAGLMRATDGNFYGTTGYGGVNDSDGTIFEMTPAGEVTTLHNFDGTDGANPIMMIQDTSGTFYGITGGGGDLNCDPTYGCGTVFSLATGLSPFVEAVPTMGNVGTTVTILGTNLEDATSVSFNETAATFTVISSSEITTAVPSGATTGHVKVTTKSGTLLSNVLFRVKK